MKKVLLSLFVLGAGLMSAQTVVFQEDFETITEFPMGWELIDSDGDGNNWDIYQVTDNAGNPATPLSAISRSWQGSALTPDNWMILPAIDLSGATGNVTLTFVTQVANQAWDEEHISVYVATANDTGSLQAADIQMSQTLGDAGNTGAPVTHNMDLSTLAGESSVFVAFRHHNSYDQDYVAIDYIQVTADNLGTIDLMGSRNISSVYPNPARDMVNVRLAADFNASKTTFTLTNMAGKQVATFASADQVNVSNLPAGVYVLTITDGTKTETKKLIKK